MQYYLEMLPDYLSSPVGVLKADEVVPEQTFENTQVASAAKSAATATTGVSSKGESSLIQTAASSSSAKKPKDSTKAAANL